VWDIYKFVTSYKFRPTLRNVLEDLFQALHLLCVIEFWTGVVSSWKSVGNLDTRNVWWVL